MVCCLAMMSKYACLCIAPVQFMNVPSTAGAAKILALHSHIKIDLKKQKLQTASLRHKMTQW